MLNSKSDLRNYIIITGYSVHVIHAAFIIWRITILNKEWLQSFSFLGVHWLDAIVGERRFMGIKKWELLFVYTSTLLFHQLLLKNKKVYILCNNHLAQTKVANCWEVH